MFLVLAAGLAFVLPLALSRIPGWRMASVRAEGRTPGSAAEPVRYIGEVQADTSHDGGLAPAVGVKNYQVMRANRKSPQLSQGFDWTYNHAPMLAYWNGRFYLEYLSGPFDEHVPPGQSLLTTSKDGRTWEAPQVSFPVYDLEDGSQAIMHQRMGFYVAPNGRLLVLGFYGLLPSPNNGHGIGRVVREVYKDGRLGPIYFIRYNSHKGWNESNTRYPLFKSSPDAGFREACAALLENKLITLQWWEEDRSEDGFYPVSDGLKSEAMSYSQIQYRPGAASQVTGGLKAFSFYHRPDGKVVGFWKFAKSALSADEGKTWSEITALPTIVTAGAKIWGQKTKDGRFALVYNPTTDNKHRWPLAIVTGDDGITFDNLLCVHGEVPPRRFSGLFKDFGPQYVRGIVEGNGVPPGNSLWVTYSVNKEDIWASEIPLPVHGKVNAPVADSFEGSDSARDWNLYSPVWAPVSLAGTPDGAGQCLELRDKDPYDYAKAVRVFPAARRVNVEFRVWARQTDHGRLEIEILDSTGKRPFRLLFEDSAQIRVGSGHSLIPAGRFAAARWHRFSLAVDAEAGEYDLSVDGRKAVTKGKLVEPSAALERFLVRTGIYRTEPLASIPTLPGTDLPGADDPVNEAVYYVDDVKIGQSIPRSPDLQEN
ncbi:MAG: hypothetical protein ACE15E_03550 [Acidobacteriota bacterium]